jgi:hypothetical protein
MILLIGAYLFLKAIFWCFAAMIWLCFASAAWMLALMAATLLVFFDRRATVHLLSSAARVFAPPDYLRSRRHRRNIHT